MYLRLALLPALLGLALWTMPEGRGEPPMAKSADALRADGSRRTDRYGDPLPYGVVARLGTVRLRHADFIHSLIFSPDGKTIASLGDDWRLSLWDTATGREQAHLPSYFHALAFAPDGRTLTTLWAGGFAQWDRQGKKLRTLREFPHAGSLQTLTVDGALAAIEDHETHAIFVWDPVAGKKRHRFTGHKTFIGSLSFSRNGKVLVSQG
ncbi:MAG: WD40 repeat domain-containing protein, partial [Gemmataceae bacterium]